MVAQRHRRALVFLGAMTTLACAAARPVRAQASEWRAARRWGRARTDTIEYDAMFVLRRDTLPLAENERFALRNDTLPRVCPAARTPSNCVCDARARPRDGGVLVVA